MSDPTVGSAIDAAAAQYGLDPTVLKGIANIESSWDPGSNRNKSTQYKGLFQLGREEWKQHGSGDIYNAQDNANAAARLLSSHSQWFQGKYGREPAPGELYMMHQQGRGFIQNGTMTNTAGNPYPGMRGPQTPESFQKGWTDALDRRMALYGGDKSAVADSQTPTPVPAPTAGGWGPMAGLFGGTTSPVGPNPGAVAVARGIGTPPVLAGPMPDGSTLQASMAAATANPDPKALASAQKVVDTEKEALGEKNSKVMMALAQQLMAGSQAKPAQFMQLQPANTGPTRPLPIDLPKFGSA